MKKDKSPLLAAILNFIIYGIGYLYLGKRKEFGYILVVSWIIAAVSGLGGVNPLQLPPGLYISEIILGIAFAYDAYKLAVG